MSTNGQLLVVQPSNDYAHRVRRYFPDAVMVATKERSLCLKDHPFVIPADLEQPAETLLAVQDFVDFHNIEIAGITTFICEAMLATADLATGLGLAYHSKDTLQNTRNKQRTYAHWRAAGVPIPTTGHVQSIDDLLIFTASTAGPWILKPVDRSGSEWVLFVNDTSALRNAHRRIQGGLTVGPDAPSFLVQQFVSGREFSADILVDESRIRILRLTEKFLIPNAVTTGHVGAYFPARFDDDLLRRIDNVFRDALRSLEITDGVVMVDAILSEDNIFLLELALRPGGDCLPDLYRYATGYDPIKSACDFALSRAADTAFLESVPAPVAALQLMAARSGVISYIDFGDLREDPSVLHVDPYRAAGDEICCWDGSYDDRILASCVVHCECPADLPELIERLTRLIRLTMSPVEPSTVGTKVLCAQESGSA